MNASNADEVCDLTPIPAPDVYKYEVYDEANAEAENLSTESEFFRIVATILVFVAWIYLIVKGYLDYEANRVEGPDDGSRNEVEGDRGLQELYNNANDLDPQATDVAADPAAAAAAAGGPGYQANAAVPSVSIEPSENDPSPVARQAAPPTERRRRHRSSDVISFELLAAFDLDDASPAAAAEDARAAQSVHGAAADQDSEGAVKPKKPLRHVRKYVRVQKTEDSRSKEPETSDEDLLPSYESKTKSNAPTDECQTKGAAVSIVTPNANTSIAETQRASAESVVDGNRTDVQSATDVLRSSDHLEDSQEIPNNQNDLEPSCGRNTESDCPPKLISVLHGHGTSVDEVRTAEAVAKTESKLLGAMKPADSRAARDVTQPASHSTIIDSLNAKLLEQLTTDLVRRLQAPKISGERLRQELDSQTRAQQEEAQSCYAGVVEQVKRGSRHPETQKEEQEEQDQQRNAETPEPQASQTNTTDITKPSSDTLP